MNSKLTDKFITITSVIGTIISIVQLFRPDISNRCPAILVIILFASVFLVFHKTKKSFADIYTICSCMALNNRLQSLRELVMVKYNELLSNCNKFHIHNACFRFHLTPSLISSDIYDVHYLINFELARPLFCGKSVNNYTIKFFVITLEASPEDFKTEISINNASFQKIESVLHNITTHGESGSKVKQYSGLWEITTVLPRNISRHDKIAIRFLYDVRGQIKKNQEKHSFTLIPKNYSSKIRQVEIVLSTRDIQITRPEFQRYAPNGDFEIATSFFRDETEPSCLTASIRPIMDSAYSIQFDLPQE